MVVYHCKMKLLSWRVDSDVANMTCTVEQLNVTRSSAAIDLKQVSSFLATHLVMKTWTNY